MTANRPALPCPVKGCSWRGPDPDACPMHASDDAWERQSSLLPGHVVARYLTRHR